MSKPSGTAEQILSLPKGGGAVQGLGATFETDLNTGTGSYSIPIGVPSGPNGIQPQIAIRYHSAAGNGPFGIGWTLGMMTIARKVEGHIPTYHPGEDQFVLVGAEDLVPLGSGEYNLRVDTMHWRIRQSGLGWELTDTRGMRHLLGQNPGSRVELVEAGQAKTAQWLIDQMRDPNGNTVNYYYLQDGAQRYLERVEWGSYRLQFFYQNRPDRLTSGRNGFLLATNLRCARIELHVTNIVPTLARSWTLEYEQAPGSGLSLLQRVTMRGHAADGSTLAAPPLTLTYTTFQPRQLERITGETPGALPRGFTSGRTELVDWDGDGLPDLLELAGGKARIWPNRGRARLGPPLSLASLPAPVALDQPGVAFADMDGNGTADLIMLDRPLTGYYPHKLGGGFDRPVYWENAPATRLANRNVRLVDLNGDGIADLLETGEQCFCLYYRLPGGGWSERPQTVPRASAPPVSLDDPRVFLVDMNGDGLMDLVRADGGGVIYWPYLGDGRWAAAVQMVHPPALPDGFDPERLRVMDVDGDACADLVYVGFDRVTVWLNQGGVRLGDSIEIAYTPPALRSQFRIADMKGTGAPGLLFSPSEGISRRSGYLYLDFSGGVKPYLLTGINNSLGLEMRIRYRPSTEFALDDAEAGRPWPTFHPFPLQCVAEMEQVDNVAGQSSITRYHYHDGRYDPQARTFLGFASVDADALGDANIPTLRNRNFYHLGLDPADLTHLLSKDERMRLGALRRRLLRTEIYALDGSPDQGKPYQVVMHEYTTLVQPTVTDEIVLVPYETRTLEETWERGAAASAFREVTYAGIDAYGNIPRQRLLIRRAGEPTPDLDVTTETTFAMNLPQYIVSLPARVTQRITDGDVISVQIMLYDGAPHTGLPEAQAAQGNLTRQEVLVLPDAVAQSVYGAAQPDWTGLGYHRLAGETGWWITQISYERQESPAGLTLLTRGPRGAESRLEYDSTRQYPFRLTDAKGNVVTGVPDARTCQMASLTDPNGRVTTDSFDALGRVVATIKPGDTRALPSISYTYRSDILPVRVAVFQRERHGQPETLDEYDYFDGRGQLIQRVMEGEGGPGKTFVAQETLGYTCRGQLAATHTAFYCATPEYTPHTAAQPCLRVYYDAIARIVKQVKASGGAITQTFSPGQVEMQDEAGTRMLHRLNGMKRVLAVEQQLPNRVVAARYAYDSLGRITRVQHPGGGETRLVYDLLGHFLTEETPDTGRTAFVYDAAGNQVQRTTAAGKTVDHTFDELDRLVRVEEDGAAAPEMVYTYLDTVGPPPPDGIFDRRTRLWQVQDRVGVITYRYDAVGSVAQTRRTVAALGNSALVTDIIYDALGRQTRITLPEPTPGAGRRVVDYVYNPRGLPQSSPSHVRSAEYDAEGRMRRLVYQNNTENLLDLDPLTGLPQRMRILDPGGATLRDQSFFFDHCGNLLHINSALAVEAGQFTYDEMYRLTGATYGSGEQYSYTYTDSGNITSIHGVGNLAYGGPPGSGAVTQAGAQAYTYTVDGHLHTAPYGTLTFDGLDNLVRVNLLDGRVMENTYDFQGQRAIKRISNGDEIITADPGVEFHNGQPVEWVTFGGKRILAVTSVGGTFLHADLHGTPTLFTDLMGAVVRRLAFGPYGNVRFDSAAGAGMPGAVRLTGQPLDPETGLFCLGRRFLDPSLGRFISADRVVSGLFRLDAWNRYLYAHNNPLRYSDPTGRFSWGDFFAILGIAVVVAALIVAGVFTGGATWTLAGVVINVSVVMFSTAVGVAAGAVVGGIAAGMAGGDIWKGVLFGGFIGGVAAFGAAVLMPFTTALGGAITNGLTGVIGAKWAGVIGAGIAWALPGAVVGAGSGAAVGFAGGKGTAAAMWEQIWKGAIIGFVTGFAMGGLLGYLGSFGSNPVLRVGTLEKIAPNAGSAVDKALAFDAAASLQQGQARLFSGMGYTGGLGSLVNVGAGPSSQALLNINIPVGLMSNIMANGGVVATTNLMIGFDKFTSFEFGESLLLVLDLVPFVGLITTMADDANWGWYEDMKSALGNTLSIHPD